MTKKVVWTSCSRLACSCTTPAPAVIICLTDSALLAPVLCPDSEAGMPYAFTTLEATLTKSWKSQTICEKTYWSYSFAYDETLLADPATALTAEQIAGAFCEGCLTTWAKEQIGNEIQVEVGDTEVTITSQHGCETAFSIAGGSPQIDWHILGNSGTTDGVNFCGTDDDVPFDIRTDNRRSRRTEPNSYVSTSVGVLDSPNILDGSEDNIVTNAVAATLSGGAIYAQSNNPNLISGTGATATTVAFGSTIGGGAGNEIDADGPPNFTNVFQGVDEDFFDYGGYSTIPGGADNRISWNHEPSSLGAGFHTIGGGQSNQIELAGGNATIGGGYINYIGYPLDLLEEFFGNQIACDTVAGGNTNIITGVIPDLGTIQADSIGANFIGSGIANQIENGWQSIITGGWSNLITATATVYGVDVLQTLQSYDFIGGGAYNTVVVGQNCSIVGGAQNKIIGDACSSIAGGMRNLIYSTNPAHDNTIAGSSYELIFPDGLLGGSASQFNVVAGGIGNYIEDGNCSSILGGAFLAIGDFSAGFQGGATRTFTAGGTTAFPFFPFAATNYSQVDLRAFSSIFYMGDVDLWIGNTNNTAKKLKFIEPNTDLDFSSAHFSSFRANAQAANIEYIWPAAAGVAGNSLKILSVVGTTVTLQWA